MVDRGTFTKIANDLSFVDEVVRSHAPLGSKTPLPVGWIPDNSSVICARGQDAYNHVGNRRFRILVEAHMQTYGLTSSKVEKSVVVMKIVDAVRECSGVGGFVRKDTITGRWFEVGDAIAREKAGQQFRSAIASTDPTKYQRKRRKRVEKKNYVGKLQEEEGSYDMSSSTLKNRSSSYFTADPTCHQESTTTYIANKTKAEDAQCSTSSTGAAKIFGGATSSKYAWGEDRLGGSQNLLCASFQRCSSTPSSSACRPDRQSSLESLNAIEGGLFTGRFEQSAANAVFPSSYRPTSTEDANESLNEKEMIHEDGGKSSQEERIHASFPSLRTSKNDTRRHLMDLQRLNTSCPSFGTDPKDGALAGSTPSSIKKQPSLVEHQLNCSDTITPTKHGRCEEVLWNHVFHDPHNFDTDDTSAFL